MPKRFLQKLFFSSSIALLTATAVFAQTETCALKIDVTRNSSEAKITGATAAAVNSETKRSYRSTLRGGMPYFADLPAGEYRITVTKAGYMRSADDFIVSCAESEESFGIELFRGSSAKIVRLYNRVQLKAPPLTRDSSRYVIGDINRSEPNDGASANTGTGAREDVVEPIPLPTPKPAPKPVIPKTISGGVVNGKATNLVKPAYPRAARAVNASGAVNVQVTIDEQGNVISAAAVSGHPLLRAAAVSAARQSKFAPTMLSGQRVKVTGVIVYNFVPPEPKKETQ